LQIDSGIVRGRQRQMTTDRGTARREAAEDRTTMKRGGLEAMAPGLVVANPPRPIPLVPVLPGASPPLPVPQLPEPNPQRILSTNPLAPRPHLTTSANNMTMIEDGTAALKPP
jgi:hypothetical protein